MITFTYDMSGLTLIVVAVVVSAAAETKAYHDLKRPHLDFGGWEIVTWPELDYVEYLLTELLKSDGDARGVFPKRIIKAEKQITGNTNYRVQYYANNAELCHVTFTVPDRPKQAFVDRFECVEPPQRGRVESVKHHILP